jgi:hypothetical protein
MKWAPFFLILVLALAVEGCPWETTGERIDNLATEKMEAWKASHPGEVLTDEKKAELRSLAEQEVISERQREKAEAVGQAAGGVSAIVGGNILGGAVLLGGALLTFLGLRPKKEPSTKPASEPASGGGA